MLLMLQNLPETAPWLELVLGLTVAASLLWLALLLFVSWRRGVTNLTPVTAPSARREARPDFLEVDRPAREAALARGDAFAGELDEKERQEVAESRTRRAGKAKNVAGFMSLFMSVFSLVTLLTGAIWRVTFVGAVWERYSASERLLAVMKAHPFAFTVCTLVIGYHIFQFVADRKWRVQD